MRLLSILFLTLSVFFMSAQDTLADRCIHSAGFGCMVMAGSNITGMQYESKLHYNQPGLYGFYKLMLPAKGNFHIAMFVSGCSRSGNLYSHDGSLAGSASYIGTFSLVRADFGMSGVFANSRGNSFFDIGLYAGGLLNASGKASSSSSYMGSSSTAEKSMTSELAGTSFGLNMEFSEHFKIIKRNYILMGIRLRLETPEVEGMRLGKMAGFHLGYAFK